MQLRQSILKVSSFAALAASLLAGCAYAPAQEPVRTSGLQTDTAQVRQGEETGFIVIGDTGVLPPDGALKLTSKAVTDYCAGGRDCSFMMLTGDNIYPSGASGDPAADAPVFQSLFVEPFAGFHANNGDAPIVVALGNHDWYTSRKGALAQVDFHQRTRPFFMDGLFFKRRVSDKEGGIDLFVIDTEMLLAPQNLSRYKEEDSGEMVPTGETGKGGTPNALPVTDAEKTQLAWLEQALAGSDARWKFIVAHHPLWQGRSDSKFTQSIALREMLLPLACRYADAYFAGHQHTIEVHQDSCETVGAADGKDYAPLPVIVSGAGAKERKVNPAFTKWQSQAYPQNTVFLSWGEMPGFVRGTVAGDQLAIEALEVGKDGTIAQSRTFAFSQR